MKKNRKNCKQQNPKLEYVEYQTLYFVFHIKIIIPEMSDDQLVSSSF